MALQALYHPTMATNFILSDLKTLCLPTMATTYTLSDFKSYALQNYPEAYKIIADVNSYNKNDLLLEFKKTCAFVQNVIGAEEEQTRGKRENKNLTTGTGKTNDGVHHAIINEAEAPAARSPANVQAVTSKRVAEIFNADCPKPRDKHSTYIALF